MKDGVIARSAAGTLQRRKVRASSFTTAKRERFLDLLALTCNARLSATEAGMSDSTVQRHRAIDPVFADQWRAALAIGAERLEELVLQHGGAGVPLEADAARAVAAGFEPPPFDFERAVRALTVYRRVNDHPGTGRRGAVLKVASEEETNAALLKLIEGVKRARGRKAAEREAGAAPGPAVRGDTADGA